MRVLFRAIERFLRHRKSLMALGVAAAAAAALLVSVVAWAQAPAPVSPLGDPASDLVGFLDKTVDAFHSANYLVAAGGVVIGLTWVLRLAAAQLHGWFDSKRGGAVVAFTTATLGFIGVTMASHRPMSVGVIAYGVVLGAGAIGGWTGVRDLLGLSKAAAPIQ